MRIGGRRDVTRIASAVVRQQGAEQMSLVASGAAFWLVISSFPTAIAVVGVFGIVVKPETVAVDLGHLADAAPGSFGSLLGAQLQRAAIGDRTGLTIGLVVSVVLALWSASAGIYNLDRAIRDSYRLPRQRYVEARARAFAGALALVLALGTIALTTTAALANAPSPVLVAVGIPSVFVGMVAAVTCLYRFAVGEALGLRLLMPGAVASAACMIVLLAAFDAYASVSTHYTAIYGAFGTAVLAMVASFLAAYAVLLGAALNVQLMSADRSSPVRNG